MRVTTNSGQESTFAAALTPFSESERTVLERYVELCGGMTAGMAPGMSQYMIVMPPDDIDSSQN